MLDLRTAPAALTPRQRTMFLIVALACAASRFVAMAKSLWDWDEALFSLGMRSYDVGLHHPHPPGFPLFIALGKLMRIVTPSDFRALQSVSLLAGMLFFPAMFLLARELRLRFDTAIVAAALCAFFPNVWFFGGAAFSDVPSIALVVFAIALLFRGVRDRRAYWLGTFVLALAIGIRPQNLLIGLFPGALATWHRIRERRFGDVVVALLIGLIVTGAAFGSAIYLTGFARWQVAVANHRVYITNVDSFHNPERPPLWRIFDRFFIKQYDSPGLSIVTSLFVAIGIAGAIRRRDRNIGYLALAFVPFCITAWLMLDRFSISRFSIGYIPMFAILAADGIERSSRALAPRMRLQPLAIERVLGTLLVAAFAIWTFPALTSVRTTVSPVMQAIEAARRLDLTRNQLFVATSMTPFVDLMLPDIERTRVLDERAVPLAAHRTPWLLAELDAMHPPPQFTFTRPRGRLWNIARRHYFETALAPMQNIATFGAGWYPPEHGRREEWRWMSAHSTTTLQPLTKPAMLRLHATLPDETFPHHPVITVKLNGTIVAQFQSDSVMFSRDFDVQPAPAGGANMLELEVDRTFNPFTAHTGDDNRDFGLQVQLLSWGPH
jgi:4-amino-4-deoxy-L-arabinose transferase-like glycosyltransferase